MEKIKSLFVKYKEIIMYVFFGGLTTLVNYITYIIFAKCFKTDEITATVIAFILSVLFAYITNRKYVFESKATGYKMIVKEIISFFSCRLFSGLLDVGIMFLFVTILAYNDLIIKLLSNIIVIILNFILSKLIVFKNRQE